MWLRCKGMVVVAQRTFIEGHGHATLLGKLAEQWGAEAGAGGRGAWVDAVDVMNGRVRLASWSVRGPQLKPKQYEGLDAHLGNCSMGLDKVLKFILCPLAASRQRA